MSNTVIAELGAAVIALGMIPGFVLWYQATREGNRFLRMADRRRSRKARHERSKNIHQGRLSNDLSAC